MKKVVVVGSGIQGVCCALALHDAGYDTVVLEKSDEMFERTSLSQEGRVHMGFTYGLDRSGRTGELMVHSALNFSNAMEEWLGPVDWQKYLLDKGYYVVHKDSLLTTNEISEYYDHLQRVYTKYMESDEAVSYFGARPKNIFEVLDTIPDDFSRERIVSAIRTEERLLEMFTFRDLLVKNINTRAIDVRTRTCVNKIRRSDAGFIIHAIDPSGSEIEIVSDYVVNCTWNNRIEIDDDFGVSTVKEPLYRFKIGLFGTIGRTVPNCSIIAGAFGNISPRMSGGHAYISWHEECMRDMTTTGITPKEWEHHFTDKAPDLNSEWIRRSVEKMAEICPAASTFKVTRLLPGVICSTGKTDIQDKNSDVHKRGDQMGIFEFDGYYSINTGKFSSAPFLAKKLIGRLQEH